VIASGPRRPFAVAAGHIFHTNLKNGCYAVMNNRLAPGGYGYLLIWGGQATLAVCVFDNFKMVSEYLNRTGQFFQEKLAFNIESPRRFGGVGDVYLPRGRRPGNIAGEVAGVQDALWGFGIRYALMSGYIAGRLAIGDQREVLRVMWRKRIYEAVRSSFVNRWIYSNWGDRSYRLLLHLLSSSGDPRMFLRELYRPRWWKTLFSPLASLLLERGRY
jgi:flavin-dependent dehydrogenase